MAGAHYGAVFARAEVKDGGAGRGLRRPEGRFAPPLELPSDLEQDMQGGTIVLFGGFNHGQPGDTWTWGSS